MRTGYIFYTCHRIDVLPFAYKKWRGEWIPFRTINSNSFRFCHSYRDPSGMTMITILLRNNQKIDFIYVRTVSSSSSWRFTYVCSTIVILFGKLQKLWILDNNCIREIYLQFYSVTQSATQFRTFYTDGMPIGELYCLTLYLENISSSNLF